MPSPVPPERIRTLNTRQIRQDGRYVVVYMVSTRRLTHNYAVQRAVELACTYKVPVVVLEALRCGHPHAADRHHAFVLQGMAEHAATLAPTPVLYHPWVEPWDGAGKGLLAAWATQAVAVVSDDWPGFFHRRMHAAAARQVPCAYEVVDSVGLLPLACTARPWSRAYDFRRVFQRTARPHLHRPPSAHPLEALPDHPRLTELPPHIRRRWPSASPELLQARPSALAALPIDHSVAPVAVEGGSRAARARWRSFKNQALLRYERGRRTVSTTATSGLSPWLHYGHISVHELLDDLVADHGPVPAPDAPPGGKRAGWWGLPPDVDAFVDQLVIWRELSHHFVHHVPDAHEWSTLPLWARTTLDAHASDPRPALPTFDQLAAAESPDPLWNAAQTCLRRDGRLHNHLRMLWGKRILEWTAHPRDALHLMLTLNDRFALDGRDPNSVASITWVLGRFDRPWGPERPIYGKVRYLSSANTQRKLKVRPDDVLAWNKAG